MVSLTGRCMEWQGSRNKKGYGYAWFRGRVVQEIAERRQDIKEAVKRMVGKGLNRRAVNMALARRKLLVQGGLDKVDETLWVICGIGSLGIQGELFQEVEQPVEAS